MDKFPSNTTLWLVLRKFESGVAGSGKAFNFTARGAPQVTASGGSGSGRLFFETPVLQTMGRELSSFTDLQKTLAQLGFNSGSALFRLNFKPTDRPLEEAMGEIDAYFNSVDGEQSAAPPAAITPSTVATPVTSEESSQSNQAPTPSSTEAEQSNITPPAPQEISSPTPEQSSHESATVSSRSATVFAPPSNTTPKSAQTPYNEADYIPTTDHARSHQSRLNVSSRPSRLAGDAELAAQESSLKQKLASIKEIDVKIRFPDQSQIVSKFTQPDSAESLYTFVKSCLDTPLVNEKFSLFYFPSATTGGLAASKSQAMIPNTAQKLLIKDLRMNGRVLVNFVWDDNAALAARGTGKSVLRPDLRKVASEIKVEDVSAFAAPDKDEDEKNKSWLSKLGSGADQGKSSGRKPGGVPKWLKLPGKK